jgi:hypothetical protein
VEEGSKKIVYITKTIEDDAGKVISKDENVAEFDALGSESENENDLKNSGSEKAPKAAAKEDT